MDNKLLLVKSITLLYLESCIEGVTENSAELAREILTNIKLPDMDREIDRHREILVGLRSTAMWMIEQPASTVYDSAALLQRIRVNVGDDDGLYAAFEDWILGEKTQESIKRLCIGYRETLRSYLSRSKVKEILKAASTKALFQEETIDWRHFVREIHTELEPFTMVGTETKHPSLVDEVDFSDLSKIESIMNKAQEESGAEGILKSGWQALNRMTGEHGGFRRGDFVVLGALQHNFKTGFTLSLFKHFALYNTPYMRDPKKKPLLIHLSLENHLTDNIMWLYINLKENETGEPCDPHTVSKEEAAAYVSERLRATGYHIHMCRYDPSDFTIHDFYNMVQGFEADGYEIHAVVIDYLNMMSKRGCNGGANGADVRDLFRRVRNFCSPRGILAITPHQLSPDAKQLLRMGVDNFVQEIANKGYWDSCKAIDQEVDLEIIVHIEKVNGESFLTVQRGKHRKPKPTPEADLYTVLKFEPVASIPDDVNGEDRSLRKVGGKTVAEGGGGPWWADS